MSGTVTVVESDLFGRSRSAFQQDFNRGVMTGEARSVSRDALTRINNSQVTGPGTPQILAEPQTFRQGDAVSSKAVTVDTYTNPDNSTSIVVFFDVAEKPVALFYLSPTATVPLVLFNPEGQPVWNVFSLGTVGSSGADFSGLAVHQSESSFARLYFQTAGGSHAGNLVGDGSSDFRSGSLGKTPTLSNSGLTAPLTGGSLMRDLLSPLGLDPVGQMTAIPEIAGIGSSFPAITGVVQGPQAQQQTVSAMQPGAVMNQGGDSRLQSEHQAQAMQALMNVLASIGLSTLMAPSSLPSTPSLSGDVASQASFLQAMRPALAAFGLTRDASPTTTEVSSPSMMPVAQQMMHERAESLSQAVPKEPQSSMTPEVYGNLLNELSSRFQEALEAGGSKAENLIGQLAILDNSAGQISAQVKAFGLGTSQVVNSFESQNLQDYQNDAAELGKLAQGKNLTFGQNDQGIRDYLKGIQNAQESGLIKTSAVSTAFLIRMEILPACSIRRRDFRCLMPLLAVSRFRVERLKRWIRL